jgi:hypothetical protein
MAVNHTLRFYENRRTPVVDAPGEKKYKPSYGKLVKQRKATNGEMKQMNGGKWLRVDVKGRKPGHPDYLSSKSMGPSPQAIQKALVSSNATKKNK